MEEPTKHSKPALFEPEEIRDYLLEIFKQRQNDMLLKAASDTSKRHQLEFFVDFTEDWHNDDKPTFTNFWLHVYYNKKERRFTHMSFYCHGLGYMECSLTANVFCLGSDFHKYLVKQTGWQFWSMKKQQAYLLTH